MLMHAAPACSFKNAANVLCVIFLRHAVSQFVGRTAVHAIVNAGRKRRIVFSSLVQASARGSTLTLFTTEKKTPDEQSR